MVDLTALNQLAQHGDLTTQDDLGLLHAEDLADECLPVVDRREPVITQPEIVFDQITGEPLVTVLAEMLKRLGSL